MNEQAQLMHVCNASCAFLPPHLSTHALLSPHLSAHAQALHACHVSTGLTTLNLKSAEVHERCELTG